MLAMPSAYVFSIILAPSVLDLAISLGETRALLWQGPLARNGNVASLRARPNVALLGRHDKFGLWSERQQSLAQLLMQSLQLKSTPMSKC